MAEVSKAFLNGGNKMTTMYQKGRLKGIRDCETFARSYIFHNGRVSKRYQDTPSQIAPEWQLMTRMLDEITDFGKRCKGYREI